MLKRNLAWFLFVARRLRDLETQNRELLQTVAKREESIHQANVRKLMMT